MSGVNYRAISALAYQHSGIVLTDAKQEMVYSRLARRLRELRLENFDQYIGLLESDWKSEETGFLNSITTNLTYFFRENHHFEYLAEVVIPELKKRHQHDRRIRVWSTAASTGEEPYSIAMVFREAFRDKSWDIRILATDLDSNVLAHARRGVYTNERVESMEPERRNKWFSQRDPEHVEVHPDLRSLLTFKQLNLLHDWPMKGPIDVVFCRNVIIYFDKETQVRLFDKVHRLMASDSWLFIGHSESLLSAATMFKTQGRTIYQRIG